LQKKFGGNKKIQRYDTMLQNEKKISINALKRKATVAFEKIEPSLQIKTNTYISPNTAKLDK
jgi:hypothetical protein